MRTTFVSFRVDLDDKRFQFYKKIGKTDDEVARFIYEMGLCEFYLCHGTGRFEYYFTKIFSYILRTVIGYREKFYLIKELMRMSE